MSVQPSFLKCPSCSDQLMETVTTALGALERCPSCLSLWVEQKLISAYSDDKIACRDALAETKALLLSTGRWCPKCFQKMVDGRVRSRGVVLHLCVTCEALWTDWDSLRKFDEFIERALRAQVEAASQAPLPPQAASGPTSLSGSTPAPAWTQIEDTSVGKVFRSMARTFDSLADGVGGTSAYTQPKTPKPTTKKTPVKPPAAKIPKEPVANNKERKILKADELPPAPAAPDPMPSDPLVSNSEVLSTETPITPIEKTPELVVPDAPPVQEPAPIEEPAEEKISALMDLQTLLETLEEQERAIEPEPVVEPEPAVEPLPVVDIQIPVVPIEAPLETPPAPLPAVDVQPEPQEVSSGSAISNLLGGAWEEEEKPTKKNKKPETPAAPAIKPMYSKPEKKGPGLFGKLGATFKSKPKPPKSVTPVTPAAPVPSVTPAEPVRPAASVAPVVPAPVGETKKITPPAPVSIPKPIQPKPAKAKKEGPGLFGKAAGLFKAKPKTPKPVPTPDLVSEKPAAMKPAPLVNAKPQPAESEARLSRPVESEPVVAAKPQTPKPVVPKPAVAKPATKPKVVASKTKSTPAVWALRLLPWILAIIAFLINYARGYDFELSFALLWSACAWSVGTMVRLFLLYPFQDFMEISLSVLLEYPGLMPAKGFPVILKGRLEPENPDFPKGPLVFVEDEKKLALNKTGTFEFVTHLFGLKNPGQFIPG